MSGGEVVVPTHYFVTHRSKFSAGGDHVKVIHNSYAMNKRDRGKKFQDSKVLSK